MDLAFLQISRETPFQNPARIHFSTRELDVSSPKARLHQLQCIRKRGDELGQPSGLWSMFRLLNFKRVCMRDDKWDFSFPFFFEMVDTGSYHLLCAFLIGSSRLLLFFFFASIFQFESKIFQTAYRKKNYKLKITTLYVCGKISFQCQPCFKNFEFDKRADNPIEFPKGLKYL